MLPFLFWNMPFLTSLSEEGTLRKADEKLYHVFKMYQNSKI